MAKTYIKLWDSYSSYFEPLSAVEVGRLVLAMMEYKSSGATPEFNGSEKFIWPAIKRDLDEDIAYTERQSEQEKASKRKRKQASASESKCEQASASESKPIKTKDVGRRTKDVGRRTEERERGAGAPTPDLAERFSEPTLSAVRDWIAYKQERREAYKAVGLKSLLTEIENRVKRHGAAAVAEVIRLSMANNWKGIIWDRIKDAPTEAKTEPEETPDWEIAWRAQKEEIRRKMREEGYER